MILVALGNLEKKKSMITVDANRIPILKNQRKAKRNE